MKYSFEASGSQFAEVKGEDGKIIREPVQIKITIEIEKSKFESLNRKYENGLAGRILKLLK